MFQPLQNLSDWSKPQQEAIAARGENVLVSAGAGSGKTSVLVERVVHCLLSPPLIDVDRLLIVTFTEAAAAEMRERIVTRLHALAEVARKAADDVMLRRLERQFARIEQAQISTLHSFCMDVIRRNFLFLGLDPKISLIPDDESQVLRANLFKLLVEEQLGRPDADGFRAMLAQFQATDPSNLYRLVHRLSVFARSQASPDSWLQAVVAPFTEAQRQPFPNLAWTPVFYMWLTDEIASAQHAVRRACRLAVEDVELHSYADSLTTLAAALDALLSALGSSDAEAPTVDSLAAALQLALAAKSPRAKDSPNKAIVSALRKQALDRLKSLLEVIARGASALQSDIVHLAPAVARLVAFTQTFMVRFQEAKRAQGVLDFQDLEHMALHALTNEASGERVRLQHQFAEIFVDEYQDTSPVQDALVRAVASEAGNVFVVGDVKQSIYRFRMAEPNLFLKQYETLGVTQPGRVIALADNYRSRKEVVDAVNFFFAQLFHKDLGGVAYDERAWMHAGAHYGPRTSSSEATSESPVPVELHVIERDPLNAAGETIDAMDARDGFDMLAHEPEPGAAGGDSEDDWTALEKEAHVIGVRIQALLGMNGHPRDVVWDKSLKRYRPIQYRDIVILLRSVKNRMNVLLDVFRKLGIPAYGATSTGFFSALEVKWLTALLQVIDNPRRELALATVLRSPLFGFSDNDLACIRTARKGHFYDAVAKVAKATPGAEDEPWRAPVLLAKVASFWRRLGAWRQLGRRAPALQLLRQILTDTDFLQYISGMSSGLIRKANVERLLDFASVYDASAADGVNGFVRKLEDNIDHDIDLGEARTLGETEDVVRIMTVHHSKGLEFPVVVVADIGKQFYRGRDESGYPLHPDYGFGPAFYDDTTDRRWKSMPSIALDALENRAFLAEEARVLYVALTRARERLILVGSVRNLSALADKATAAFSEHDMALPPFLLQSAKSWLEWMFYALVRHPAGHAIRTLADAPSAFAPPADIASLPLTLTAQVWNHPQGQPLAVVDATAMRQGTHSHLLPCDVEMWPEWLATQSTTDSASEILIVNRDTQSPLIPGKVSATDIRRLWAAKKSQQKTRRWHANAAENLLESPVFVEDKDAAPGGARAGNAFHAIMQVLDLTVPPTVADVLRHLADLRAQGVLDDDTLQAVDATDIVAWLTSDLAEQLRQASQIYREQPFFYRIALAGKNDGAADFVVAQGVIDCLARLNDGRWLLVDYKTDHVDAAGVPAKAEEYAAQIATYLAAVQPIVGDASIQGFIYFVKPRMSVPMKSMALHRVFGD